MQGYSYNNWVTLYLCVVTGILWLLVAVIVATFSGSVWSLLGGMLIGIGAASLTRTCLSRATILENADAISAYYWGVRTRSINWAEVKKIVKTRTPIGRGYYVDKFQVYGEDHGIACRFLVNICGNIAFDERIRGARQLLDQVNLRAKEHAIPLFVWDLQALAKQSHVPGEKRMRGRTEVPVSTF